ncbi:hypothetical protein BJX70DRAFT_366935 [Aspergillus crustosus]
MATREVKVMIIYDCDPRLPEGHRLQQGKGGACGGGGGEITTRPHLFLLPAQVALRRYLRQQEKLPIKALFYYMDTRKSGRGKCLYYTMKWMRKMIKYRDAPFRGFSESGRSLDRRTRGCALVTKL